MTTITAQTILRSRHAQRPKNILSTLLLRYPRPIHAEFMTHRALSKNSASSRAIPASKLIQDVLDDPYVPLHWGKNQKGMQAIEECSEPVDLQYILNLNHSMLVDRQEAWLLARNQAVVTAQAFNKANYHKQIVNRILEPYSHITVLASGTEWSNFLALRDHPDAEPHIQILAREVRRELEREDNIQDLDPGEWHTPFVDHGDRAIAHNYLTANGVLRKVPMPGETIKLLIKKSVACCASTSYKTVDGFDMTLEKAIELHDKLVGSTPLHASPAEHVAQADDFNPNASLYERSNWGRSDLHGNFQGFMQYRKMLPNENL